MAQVEEFLAAMLPAFKAGEKALHDGDAAPRMAMWSHNDPVTLYGALLNKVGWAEVGPAFEWLASRFTRCESYEFEVLAAGASGDLAYLVGIERTVESIGGAPAEYYSLRSTTIFRRENGEWKAVHRHADPAPESGAAREQIRRLADGSS